MANHPPQAFLDTVQIVSEDDVAVHNSGAKEADFAATVQIEGEVWPESPDFQSSETASLFAGTQPAKLSVV
jgi:hypothetical protein